MRAALEKTLRSQLEKTVQKAREIVETAVSEILARLGVAENSAPSYLSDDERKLRNRLRAHGRQLGDVLADNGSQSTELLINEMAYEHWHRMLFARFLEQNHLLMYDPQTPVTLDECAELAADEGFSDGWQLAAKLAEKMLPQIFKTGSPVFDVKLAINHIRALEQLINDLHPETFQAADSLGWCYQFWQSKRKDEVNASGVLIGAQELSPVTQLFTEPYMVSFLLDNALGAWWAKLRLSQDDLAQAPNEQHLRELAAIDGVPLTYLRFVKVGEEGSQHWQPAAGWFDAWPNELKDLKTLDPCCGSGHFLVALFLMLVPMRMQLEGLSARDAVDSVLRDNLHGLELDLRCVDIAAFAVALEAWRYPDAGGYRPLPPLQIACSGLDVSAASKNWQKIANGNPELTAAMQWFSRTFKDAPVLGSLIDPNTSYFDGKNEGKPAPWQLLLSAQQQTGDEEVFEAQVTAQGLALAAKLLASSYHFVATNVPYLSRSKQCQLLRSFCESYYSEAQPDLATVFLERCLGFSPKGGTSSIVLPQNWLFLTSYRKFREKLLKQNTWNLIARLGAKGFQTPMWDFNVQLITISKGESVPNSQLSGLDVSEEKTVVSKIDAILHRDVATVSQSDQLLNQDCRVSLSEYRECELLMKYSSGLAGILNGDSPRFLKLFWEFPKKDALWSFQQTTQQFPSYFGGLHNVVFYDDVNHHLRELEWIRREKLHDSDQRGKIAFGKQGVSVSSMGSLPSSLFIGSRFDSNVAVILPNNAIQLPAIFCYVQSDEYRENVRQIDQALKVTNSTLVKVPFDYDYWDKYSREMYPKGIPKPFSEDLTQWICHGHPSGSVVWDENSKWTAIAPRRIDETVLQVALARLVGYQWPAELDPEMELADEMRYWLQQNSVFASLVDDDGIVCIPSVRGEKPAADRLEAMLQLAYAEDWSANTLQQLLLAVGSSNLQQYLRDKFFEQHCKIFQNRPFIWQIWDGLKDGFSALVNYHKLDNKGLERLIYTYLGDWIRTQEHGVKEGVDGADIRLTAAKNLETRLKAILEGEKGLDIFVRWKPLHEQPIGWNPDLNDGVRLNIRPFMKVADVGKKGAGVLRIAPKIDWKKDRGTDVPSAPWYHLGPQYGEQEGSRINDHCLTLAEKQAARAEQNKS
ncbi:BREX-1 system adenine-specific DNA-methyltransferase PglX [Rheinheimera sp. MM224]|uniref:BREX-1 system adenine-specific DNA-methyltransferase PglX n=1 Tax=Rheinheimera sp. MM224 TaxID=3019969 RepID=UPI0021F8F695|nr:BREX-1 system adenine-specific DNA-methyltransferase PglX [Rheinheimera sp. MM224]CAI3798170.1 hypothetical protein JAMGFMIE_02004 [Rheinheimera sp. MM224]